MTREERMQAFPLRCRVQLSAKGRDHGILERSPPGTHYGTVVGYGRLDDTIRVRRDTTSAPDSYHWTFWDRCESSAFDSFAELFIDILKGVK